ncbi:uncharacterized protein LOC129908583 [Episyrphus balteatus]|uniref:uncharacterized protein LOC129908583 n=1 Tax=Episyrphus balteatus TaxID=286459 RepID=UPI0024861137|nr:uncharacterized protein LOC129908583 [Episyrphus balteatus]
MTEASYYKYGELQKGVLTKISKDLVNFKKAPKERKTAAYSSVRLAKLEADMATSKIYHEAIIGGGKLEEGLKKEDLLVVYDQIYEIYLEYEAELVEAVERAKSVASNETKTMAPTNFSAASSSHSAIRLPRLDLPKFNGSYVAWRDFHDRFQSLVHNNTSIDDIDKLHFLQSCLVGDAHRFLQNLSVEAASYDKAWKLLEERYDHKCILVHIQMQALFGQPSLPRETASAGTSGAAATVAGTAGTASQPRTTSSNTFQASVNTYSPEFQPTVDQPSTQTFNYHTSHGQVQTHQVLLATAVVKARDADGRTRLLRALIDTGSETSFITESAAQLLKLEKRRTFVEVSGLGLVSSGKTQFSVDLHLASRHSTFEIAIQAYIFKSLTGHLPTQRVISGKWNHLKELSLADPYFFEPAPIDLLLGSDVCAQIFLPEIQRPLDGNGPIAQNTHFGWVVLGKVPVENPRQVRSFVQTHELCMQVERFFVMEEMPFPTYETLDNIACEEHFTEHTIRLPDGRYQVELPFKDGGHPVMGFSRQNAFRRFLALEKKLAADPKLAADYTKCMKEYVDLHHMEEIAENDAVLATPYHYFLPNHTVFKDASSTTKLRVVFDAASRASDGKSLNDRLLVGPRLQTSIIDLVLRWRTHRITFTADIEKMYRQILVSFPDRYYQLVMWREQNTAPLKIFKMYTVTFGTASAPYLAIKILKKVADDEQHNFPEGAKVVREDMYVDDLISGADSIEEARKKRDEARQLLATAGFNLPKWTSNVRDLVEDIPAHDRELDFELPINLSNHVKTLGIKWFPMDDCFSYQNLQPSAEVTTKRSILSTIAKLFDPLGWISPCIITEKIMMQRLWELGCDWDEPVPATLKNEWEAFQRELPLIEKLRIPRWIHMSPTNKAIELHGFCDASMKAYGAAVYVRVLDSEGKIHTNLLLAKTRVAPSQRTITLPRLELCGAVLVAQLLQYTKEVLGMPDIKMYAWTDSTIALAWIRAIPAKWTTYVSNRVSEIQLLIGINCWGHVSTHHNPSDMASRGVFPSEIQGLDNWWFGPKFLRSQWNFESPTQPAEVDPEEERRSIKVLATHLIDSDNVLQAILNSSSLLKVVRVIATSVRFIIKCRPKLYGIITGPLQAWELDLAHLLIIKAAQKEMFENEIEQIKQKQIPKHLRALNPFIDVDGILRVVWIDVLLPSRRAFRKFSSILQCTASNTSSKQPPFNKVGGSRCSQKHFSWRYAAND